MSWSRLLQHGLPFAATLALGFAAVANAADLTLSGSLDLGFSHRADNVDARIGSKNAIDSGAFYNNRIAFSGEEDLGGGLKTFFLLEAGFWADTGAHLEGQLFNRQIYLGVSGPFGRLSLGRQYAASFIAEAALDPFDANGVGNYRNTFQNIAVAQSAQSNESLFDPTRIDNALVWVSPGFSGASLLAMAATNAIGQEGSLPDRGRPSVDNSGDLRYFALMPRFQYGPVDLLALWQKLESNGELIGADQPEITKWMIGGSHQFDGFKVSLFYDRNKLQTPTPAKDGVALKNWMLGLSVPLGRHALLASFAHSQLSERGRSGTARQIALGYTYDFSRRSQFYLIGAKVKNDRDRKAMNAPSVVFDAENLGEGYQRGLQFGLIHKF